MVWNDGMSKNRTGDSRDAGRIDALGQPLRSGRVDVTLGFLNASLGDNERFGDNAKELLGSDASDSTPILWSSERDLLGLVPPRSTLG